MTKIIYHYHPESKEYLGSSEAQRSPLDKEEIYLIPACAVDFAPNLEDEKITYFENDSWVNKTIEIELVPELNLDDQKNIKLAQLKSNRDLSLSKSFIVELDNSPTQVYVNKSDYVIILARIARLEDGGLTSAEWSDIEGNRIELDLGEFKSLRNHIDARDQQTYQLYFSLKKEIEAVTVDGEYVDENNQPITPLQYLENININFN